MSDTENDEREGWAIFMPDGSMHLPTIRSFQDLAIESYTSPSSWRKNYEPKGYTVRPVTILVKDEGDD